MSKTKAISANVQDLGNLKTSELREKHLEVFGGETARSLSKVSREITGQIWNGYLFTGPIQRPTKTSA